MAKRKKRPARREFEFKSAFVSVSAAELGWSGPRGGRTVEVVFRDGSDAKVGTLQISAAKVRWWGPGDKKPVIVSTKRLDDLFEMWQSH